MVGGPSWEFRNHVSVASGGWGLKGVRVRVCSTYSPEYCRWAWQPLPVVGDPASETRPLSALISNLKHHEIFVRKSFGNRVIMQANAISFKPRLCFDQLDSPRIGAGQEILREKRGVCLNRFAWHEGSARKVRRTKTGPFSTATTLPS